MKPIQFKQFLVGILLSHCIQSFGTTCLSLKELNAEAEDLFGYTIAIESIHESHQADEVLVTCHGFGANKDIGFLVAQQIDLPIITFNFPDHDFDHTTDLHATSLGSINEYLPLIYLLKKLVDGGISIVHLYGFSAGGGAVVAVLGILAAFEHQEALGRVGVYKEEVCAILEAISRGTIILDAPLKSVQELLESRPHEEFLKILAARYNANLFEPIKCIEKFAGLALTIFLYFEQPDEILSNRDDSLFYRMLCEANVRGTTKFVCGSDGGHNGVHRKLWDTYRDHERTTRTVRSLNSI